MEVTSLNIILQQQDIESIMKQLFFVMMCAISIMVYGNTTDSLRIVSLQREVSNLKVSVSRLQQEDQRQQNKCELLQGVIDSLKIVQARQAKGIDTFENNMKHSLFIANRNLQKRSDALSNRINNRSWIAVCGILIALVLLGVVFFIFRKKISSGSSALDKIKSAQEELENAQKAMQEESVKLDGKLVELLDKQLIQPHDNVEENHKLVLSIATEVARIEQNLAFMDPKTKGVSNLKNRASAIKTTLQSRGYDIPTLIGETYHEGDNMKPTMELDEELPVGTQIIRRVMKPMVLFRGRLIQAAEVVVAYNE